MKTLAQCVLQAAVNHKSLRALARDTGLDVSYLSRLASGEKTNPTDETLEKLGIERVVTYRMFKK